MWYIMRLSLSICRELYQISSTTCKHRHATSKYLSISRRVTANMFIALKENRATWPKYALGCTYPSADRLSQGLLMGSALTYFLKRVYRK